MSAGRLPARVVVTTINAPTAALVALAERRAAWPLLVVGDNKTPGGWELPGSSFLSMEEQRRSGWRLAPLLPENHYCRKNLGYLEAVRDGARVIAETDDDNFPQSWPPAVPDRTVHGRRIARDGWTNVYPFFTDELIWPRGFPLRDIHRSQPLLHDEDGAWQSEVHQYLAAGDPDVDSIYRLTVGKTDHRFREGAIVLAPGTVTPFNSQSTLWFDGAFELMYLPSFVSFRMTDIWRSLVAQVCMWPSGMELSYHGDGVLQERNEHDLMVDFRDEVVGYERNEEIVDTLRSLPLSPDRMDLGANLVACYQALHAIGIVEARELPLVEAWLHDIARARG